MKTVLNINGLAKVCVFVFMALLVALPEGGYAQIRTKKQLLKEREQMYATIDSLKAIIKESEAQTLEQEQYEEELSSLDSNYVLEGYQPDTISPMWYFQNRQSDKILDLDSVVLQSNTPDEVYLRRLNKMNSFIPLSYNNIIKNNIILYTERIPSRSADILGLGAYYLPLIEEILDECNMPKELKAMAIIESAFNPVAVSRAKAKGLWQFMHYTGLQYGLRIDSYVDERLDPYKATRAAAAYLKNSYEDFKGDWFLAISSYNCGTGNVKKAIRRAGSNDFWDIYPYLPRETRGYVPAFIGALYLLEYYEEHNIKPVNFNFPVTTDTIVINRNVHFDHISKAIGIPVSELKKYNPQYLQNIIPGEKGEFILRLPSSYIIPFIEKEDEIYAQKVVLPPPPPPYIIHKVRKGETLTHIARKYGVSVSNLMKWNKLTSKSTLRIGQSIKVRGGKATAVSSASSSGSQKSATAKSGSASVKTSGSGGYQWYTIKKGDTLYGISLKCKVPLNSILKLNGLKKNSKIYPGKKIKIKKL